MKQILFAALISATSLMAGQNPPASLTGRYDLHLYFDEKPFLDYVTLQADGAGRIIGTMHVPNDFDAPIEKFEIADRRFFFEILVPKNSYRPKDLRFRYEGEFFDDTFTVFTGFVKDAESKDKSFIASFLGHRLKQ